MIPLTRSDLLSLELYAQQRSGFRARVLEHKQRRTVHLAEHLTLLFEDRQTVHYQIQEMLRIERIFEAAGIQAELDAYNPLIPDGGNLKATLLIEFTDGHQRRNELKKLRGIEDHFEIAMGDETARAIADEDMERSNDEKTSAVHFLRFELSQTMRAAWIAGSIARLRCTHPASVAEVTLTAEQCGTLAADFT